jgi:hypothetical protein
MQYRSIRHRFTRLNALPATLALLAGSAHALDNGVVAAPFNLTAYVQEAVQPGGTVQSDVANALGAVSGSDTTAEKLLIATKGINASGRSTNIPQAFASATAKADGDGGVGVSGYEFNFEQANGGPATRQLSAQASWAQTFTNNGTSNVTVNLQLHIPSLQVQLMGVAPNRDGFSATETASAIASLAAEINHVDGSVAQRPVWQFGLKEFESQINLSPAVFANFGDLELILEGSQDGVNLFSSLTSNDSPNGEHNFNPKWTLDAVSTSVSLGTLKPGESVDYLYQLTAHGGTNGGERGYNAFLGDPFNVQVLGGNLAPTISVAVPEPPAVGLMLAGLAGLAWRRRWLHPRSELRLLRLRHADGGRQR